MTSPPTPGPGRCPSRWRAPTGSARSRSSCCAASTLRGRCGCSGCASPGFERPTTPDPRRAARPHAAGPAALVSTARRRAGGARRARADAGAELVEHRRPPRGGRRPWRRRRPGSAAISSSSARSVSPASSAANASVRSGSARLRELDPGGEAVGGERAGHLAQQRERLAAVPAGEQQLGERHGRVGPARARARPPAQRGLVAERRRARRPGGQQPVEEPLDGRRRLGAGELRRHLAVTERLDRGNRLDSVAARQVRAGVDVELGELDRALAGGDRLLEHRAELAARAAPLRPEVDDDRNGGRALDDGVLEGGLGDIHGRFNASDGRSRPSAPAGRARRGRVPAPGPSIDGMSDYVIQRAGVDLSLSDEGEGPAVVLLHGLTATRRYVVMGSSALRALRAPRARL